jgi:hypothetical protein
VKDAEEAEALKPRPRGDSEDFDGDEDKPEKEIARRFDYSKVGNIGVYERASSTRKSRIVILPVGVNKIGKYT